MERRSFLAALTAAPAGLLSTPPSHGELNAALQARLAAEPLFVVVKIHADGTVSVPRPPIEKH